MDEAGEGGDALIWDVAAGLATLAKSAYRTLPQQDAQALGLILERLHAAAEGTAAPELVALLAEARERVGWQAG